MNVRARSRPPEGPPCVPVCPITHGEVGDVEGTLAVVRGRLIEGVAAVEMRRTANTYARVVVDVGTGDGRWLYRTARAHPEWLCLGLDADAGRMREVSRRASRDLVEEAQATCGSSGSQLKRSPPVSRSWRIISPFCAPGAACSARCWPPRSQSSGELPASESPPRW